MDVLTVQNLIKRYRSPDGVEAAVVDVPSFALASGQHVALRGASGSGKTTFLNLIAGILRADTGAISVNGESMTGRPEAGRDGVRARHIGYVFQTFNLLQGYTALENVLLGMMFGPGPDPLFARTLLERVGLGDRVNYRPRQLSVGQQQRVALARAVANRPRLVLADEPTGNLDPHHAEESLRTMSELCVETGAALLLVSHDPAVLGRFDDVREFSEINRAITGVAP